MRQQDQRLIERFRDRVRGGALSGLRITLRIAGGHPSERLDHRLVLDGDGTASLEVDDALAPGAIVRRDTLDDALWTEIDQRVDRFTSRERARFVPDSLVGSATLEVDGERVELVFAPDAKLVPHAHETGSMPLLALARRTILAARRAPQREED